MVSTLPRTIAWLKENGYTYHKTEYYNMFARRRVDLFGFGDILAIKPGEIGSLAINATTDSNKSNHLKKYLTDPVVSMNLKKWLSCGNRFVLHLWGKHGQRGKRKTWQLNIHPITMGDFYEENTLRLDGPAGI